MSEFFCYVKYSQKIENGHANCHGANCHLEA